MKKAFTMIELIFVIVIIGILAAVALPRLAATRDDAQISVIIANARTALGDMASFYSSQGSAGWENNASISTITNIPFTRTSACTIIAPDEVNQTKISPNVFTLCDNNDNPCVTFTTSTGANLVITTDISGEICSAVAEDMLIKAITKSYHLGGKTIVR